MVDTQLSPKEEESAEHVLGAFQWLQAEEDGSRTATHKPLFREVQRKAKTERVVLRQVWFP